MDTAVATIMTELSSLLQQDTLYIEELRFSAAQYINGHPSCGRLHGHTYFLRNLTLTVRGFVDFGDIKGLIRQNWDHKLIIPKADEPIWTGPIAEILAPIGVVISVKTVQGTATCENISRQIANELLGIKGVMGVKFLLCEGPEQGTVFEKQGELTTVGHQ